MIKRNEKGSITLFTLIAMMFFLTIAFTAYASAMIKLQAQNEDLERIKASYEQDLTEEGLRELYNKLTGTREWLPGEGTEQNPYKIYTIEDLVELSNRTNKTQNSENFSGKYVELINDIDFNDVRSYENAERIDFGDINGDSIIEGLRTELTTYEGFQPIGKTDAKAFAGNFNGNGNEIKNLYEDKKVNNRLGLFATTNNATLQNFGITGNISNKVSGDANTYQGGIVGLANGICNIKDIHNAINVSCNFNNGKIGGIVGGSSAELKIENSYNSGEIIGGMHTGGIIGYTDNDIKIFKCYNTGKIKNEYLSSNACVGGLISFYTNNNCEIMDSYNDGIIKGCGFVGGINGRGYNGKLMISNCINKNKIESNYIVGGISGTVASESYIINCINTGEVSFEDKNINSNTNQGIGGIVGLSYGVIENCINEGNIRSMGGLHTGGIAGYNRVENSLIKNCYNKAIIICQNTNMVGGIIGRQVSGAKIKNCYSIGTFSYQSVSYLGAINGYNYSPSVINNSYYLDTIATEAYKGNSTYVVNCLAKKEQEMKETAFVTLLNTDNEEPVWTSDTNNINNGYPILKWQLDK